MFEHQASDGQIAEGRATRMYMRRSRPSNIRLSDRPLARSDHDGKIRIIRVSIFVCTVCGAERYWLVVERLAWERIAKLRVFVAASDLAREVVARIW